MQREYQTPLPRRSEIGIPRIVLSPSSASLGKNVSAQTNQGAETKETEGSIQSYEILGEAMDEIPSEADPTQIASIQNQSLSAGDASAVRRRGSSLDESNESCQSLLPNNKGCHRR